MFNINRLIKNTVSYIDTKFKRKNSSKENKVNQTAILHMKSQSSPTTVYMKSESKCSSSPIISNSKERPISKVEKESIIKFQVYEKEEVNTLESQQDALEFIKRMEEIEKEKIDDKEKFTKFKELEEEFTFLKKEVRFYFIFDVNGKVENLIDIKFKIFSFVSECCKKEKDFKETKAKMLQSIIPKRIEFLLDKSFDDLNLAIPVKKKLLLIVGDSVKKKDFFQILEKDKKLMEQCKLLGEKYCHLQKKSSSKRKKEEEELAILYKMTLQQIAPVFDAFFDGDKEKFSQDFLDTQIGAYASSKNPSKPTKLRSKNN